MSTDRYYRSRSRSAKGKRGEPQSDAITVALTVQILLCIVLLLSANIVKRVNETGYFQFKATYMTMVTDSGQTGKLAGLLSGWGDSTEGFFSGVERSINSIVGQARGDEVQEENPVAEPEPSDEGDSPSNTFDYNYLDGETAVYKAQELGMGGMNPVDVEDVQRLAAPDGASLAPVALAGVLKPPVTGMITSMFAYRIHPISGKTDFHNGMDIAAEEGRPILAALPGEVVEVGEDDIYGNYIILQHATNLQTFYAHCSKIIAQEGMAVRQGERIALVGKTGTATGPHLHFSIIVDETFTNPYWVLQDNIRVVE